jgi:hypothetical protein
LGLRLGLLTGLGYALLKMLQRRENGAATVGAPTWPAVTPRPPGSSPEPGRAAEQPARPEPSGAPAPPPQPTPPAPSTARSWVEASSDGACPSTHPVKAKLSSRIFHLPGMFAYERTNPDRCYATEDAAVADGFRKAKR